MNSRPPSMRKLITQLFKQYTLVGNALLGMGIGLLVVGSIFATVATLGAAAPTLGISLTATVSFFGSVGITVLAGSSIIALSSFITSIIFSLKRWFDQSNSKKAQSTIPAADVDIAAVQPLGNDTTALLQDNLSDTTSITAVATTAPKKLSSEEKHNEKQRNKSQVTREQMYTLLMLRNRGDNLFNDLPLELIQHCFMPEDKFDYTSDIGKALRYAADGEEKDVTALLIMLDKNPKLLLQAGNVITPGGLDCRRVTIYECCLGAGDPELAAKVQVYFERIPQGAGERNRQYERYRPHIEALANQIASKQPAFDVRPLIELIKQSSVADISAALNKNMAHESALRDALITFRQAVRPKRKAVGMHYEHYTTLLHALDLFYHEWEALSDNYANYDKCDLVWRQIIGYLQRSLPAVDRFAYARAFEEQERTLKFKYDEGLFPASRGGDDDLDFSGLGFDLAIFGAVERGRICWLRRRAHGRLENTCRAKMSDLQNLCRNSPNRSTRPGV